MSAFDHPWLGGLLGDPETAAIWSAERQLEHMLAFEAAWSRAGHLAGLWEKGDGAAAATAVNALLLKPESLASGTAEDGVCVPALVRSLRDSTGSKALHKGATSQDVVDTATALSVVETLDLFEQRLLALCETLVAASSRFGQREIMGRTRMQAAMPVKAAVRLNAWLAPIKTHLERLSELRPRVAKVQIGGAVGDRGALGDAGQAVADAVASELGLGSSSRSWHSRRDGIAEFASLMSLISGSLGKIGQDIALMAQQGIDDIALSGGGGSSAMPHKQNPILAELLVTLARFNATQLSGMHQALVHEQERSGAAWTLEWMILPQMAQATGRGLVAADTLIRSIERMGQPR